LAPILKEKNPEVDVYLGTINTNRFDEIDRVLTDSRMSSSIKGLGFQWEGGQILPALRKKYPKYKYVQTESECGWGSFDWKAAEHTFGLINHYLANGVEEYTFWNVILADEGTSGWGWKQNALIRVDSKINSVIYTPEYYAVKHYTHFVSQGTKLLTAKESEPDKIPVMIFVTTQNKYLIMVGNFNDISKDVSVKIKNQYMNLIIPPHSIHTLVMK
jgi:glucosylceramidase